MNVPSISRRQALGLMGACVALPALVPSTRAAVPSASIYQLDVSLTDQEGRQFKLADLRGEPMLASMFYTSCDMVCPMIFETIKSTLAKAGAGRMRTLMVSFDPARDTVPVLKHTALAHGVDEHWTLARTDDASTRKIAGLLGVQYRRLANGEFNHSSVILLIDGEGRITARSGMLGATDPKLLQAISKSAPAGA